MTRPLLRRCRGEPDPGAMAEQLRVDDAVLAYVRDMSLRDDEILRGLREETRQLPGGAALQVSAEEGQFLALLASLTGASRVLEIGTFTGYSTLCLARAVQPGGQVVTLDITDRWPAIGRPFWEQAGVQDRIDVRVGDARDTCKQLVAEDAVFDLVFIDADKAGYADYYELSLNLVRPGGLIVIDNTLFFGRVVDPSATDADTEGVRRLNEILRDDERVDITLLTLADGVTLARRR